MWPTGGGYPHDEAAFLHHIIETIRTALRGFAGLSLDELAAWITTRHQQIERSELIYIAHQLDVTGFAPG